MSLDELQAIADVFGVRPGQLVATERDDDLARAFWLLDEREARQLLLEDEVAASELALRHARERCEAGRALVQEASDMVALAVDQHERGDGGDGQPEKAT